MPESSVLRNSHTPEPLPGGGSTAYVRSTTTSLGAAYDDERHGAAELIAVLGGEQ
jgi:hypothetical protein